MGMKHYGDITKINGHDVPIVDCIVGGSPCQDLSVAGKRAGLAGERSGLFVEQIRIIKEQRDESKRRADKHIRPRFAVWENVAGAFSSGTPKGEDFRIVLEEFCRIADPSVSVPRPADGKWQPAGEIVGDGWSVAWRTHDAQYWGVAQRRRRISVVADFGTPYAGELLFERVLAVSDGLQGNHPQSGGERKATAEDTAGGVGDDDRVVCVVEPIAVENHPADSRVKVSDDGKAQALTSRMGTCGGNVPLVLDPVVAYGISAYESNAMKSQNPDSGIYEADTARTLDNNGGNPACNQGGMVIAEAYGADFRNVGISQINGTLQAKPSGGSSVNLNNCCVQPAIGFLPQMKAESMTPMVEKSPCLIVGTNPGNQNGVIEAIGIGRDAYNSGANAKFGMSVEDELQPPMTAKGPGAVAHTAYGKTPIRYIARRLTPVECERLQGFPDGWTDIGEWTDSKGKKRKSANALRYKALGNSIALPFWRWLMRRISAEYVQPPTMASLFDGIGGFPLIWQSINGDGTAVWASEIDEFPMAVTKFHFGEE